MTIEHVNRRGDRYYLHEGKTKKGNAKYFFSQKREGTLAESIPAGYEIYENPNSQVFLRKIPPKVITDEEVATVEQGVRELAELTSFIIDVKGEDIVVHLPDQSAAALAEIFTSFGLPAGGVRLRELERFVNYAPMMRFTLADTRARRFTVARWCFRGSIDGWFPLRGYGGLQGLVEKYCPHLGQESFYELF